MKNKETLDALSVREKIELVSGTDFMYTNGVERLGVKRLSMADGPHGVRKQIGYADNGIATSEPATSFPTAVTTASGWNVDNLLKMGEAIGKECLSLGVDILLGPGVNIKKNPLCGRNFEYFSEDPYLAGVMGAAHVRGVQKTGVGTSLKHFALNNSENFRFMGNSLCDMRAMREIYLAPFERVVKEAKPDTVMCAYNAIRGVRCCENEWLLTDILRGEWGFEGVVMTDWGAMRDRRSALLAGLDLETPGDADISKARIYEAMDEERVSEALDRSADRVLTLAEKYKKNTHAPADLNANHDLAARIAEDSAVLLKNDGALPLGKDEDIAVIGELFSRMRYQGAGSSMINATRVVSPKDAMDERHLPYEYARGYRAGFGEADPGLIEEAIALAEKKGKLVLFLGLTDEAESEGFDRENMNLPEGQRRLVEALLPLGKPIVTVLFGGSPISLPFADEVSAILNMYLPGQAGGEATVRLLYGDTCPSGRLAETFPLDYCAVPFGEEYSKKTTELYKESIFVGYRHYMRCPERVRYPFGFGLSYTRFSYENMTLTENEDSVIVEVDVKNIGGCYGGEVVQLYVGIEKSAVPRPHHELRAFQKVYLAPNEKTRVTLSVKKEELRYFDVSENRFVLEGGEYAFRLCSDCMTPILEKHLYIEGEHPVCPYSEAVMGAYTANELSGVNDEIFEELLGMPIPKEPIAPPITMETRLTDFKYAPLGKLFTFFIGLYISSRERAARRLPHGTERDNKIKGARFLRQMIESNNLYSISMSAARTVPYHLALAIMHLANGRLIKALRALFDKPKLPKE